MNKTVKVFFDTEFIEYFVTTNTNKKKHTIDLISIALVKETGESYQAISKDYEYDDASKWVKDNVILPLYKSLDLAAFHFYDDTNFHKYVGKDNTTIAAEIKAFIGADTPIFYGYYADYDWVLLCSLFGTMMDLPEGYPMYCRDIQQIIDGQDLDKEAVLKAVPQINNHLAINDALWNKAAYKQAKQMLSDRKKK